MPSILPPYRTGNLLNTPESFADPLTGRLEAFAARNERGLTNNVAAVGGPVMVPRGVVALTAYATLEVSFECRAWAAFFGKAESSVNASIAIENSRRWSAPQRCGWIIGWARAWVGTHGTGPVVLTVPLRCNASWGTPLGLAETFQLVVSIGAWAWIDGAGGAWARAATHVRYIDYEMIWP